MSGHNMVERYSPGQDMMEEYLSERVWQKIFVLAQKTMMAMQMMRMMTQWSEQLASSLTS